MYSDTIKNIIDIQNRQKNRDIHLKNKHIQMVHEKINNYANLGKQECIYIVPSFLIGYSPYDVNSITKYIYKSLKKEGFYITVLTNECIYICWNINLLFKDSSKSSKDSSKSLKDNSEKNTDLNSFANLNKKSFFTN